MKIYRIFEVIEGSLYTVKYLEHEDNEFLKIFDNWTDVEFLYNFFEEHIQDLQSDFFGKISIEEAIERTIKEAEKLEQKILSIAEKGKTDSYKMLQTLFKPLFPSQYKIREHQKSKTSGSRYKSWLRVYAIRIARNVFVVSGGAIKLTKTMNEREHTNLELQKLDIVKDYLIDNGLFDEDDFEYLEIK